MSKINNYLKVNYDKFKQGLGEKNYKIIKNITFSILLITIVCTSTVVFAADDPLAVVNNLSDFIFRMIKIVGHIILGFGLIQFGLSIKSHDPSQRANSVLTFAGGVIIAYSKEILDFITRY